MISSHRGVGTHRQAVQDVEVVVTHSAGPAPVPKQHSRRRTRRAGGAARSSGSRDRAVELGGVAMLRVGRRDLSLRVRNAGPRGVGLRGPRAEGKLQRRGPGYDEGFGPKRPARGR